jgi:hypothetical protein
MANARAVLGCQQESKELRLGVLPKPYTFGVLVLAFANLDKGSCSTGCTRASRTATDQCEPVWVGTVNQVCFNSIGFSTFGNPTHQPFFERKARTPSKSWSQALCIIPFHLFLRPSSN